MNAFKTLIENRHTLTCFKDSAELPFSILRDIIRKLELSVEATYKPRNTKLLPELNKIDRPIGMGFFSPELASLFYCRPPKHRDSAPRLFSIASAC
ncbi:hypothetical protein [Pedobacter sp. V48]|uniref:hypothetical protein n=1 Tax=Pedobacter sp. V48 TaxID=509635 RepID=UPI0003E519C7|nr:hypothetical protein [Pedobacter sp. V48]ETZ22824.1 hypothetical protein N824_21275 [Pedobacter sp. V48]